MARKLKTLTSISIPVVVIHESPDDAFCHVVPGPASVKMGDSVRWFNLTTKDITITFPHDSLGTGKGFQIKVGKGKSHTSNGASKKGSFEYQIFCEETGNNAVGSDPEIIIV